MFLNKQKRIQYLGFNDLWFTIIGILIISFVSDYIISQSSFSRLPFKAAILNWSVSLFFSIVNWFINRAILIALRKQYPNFKDDTKRIIIFFSAISLGVIATDFLGSKILLTIFRNLGMKNANITTRPQDLVAIIIITIMIMAIYEAVYYYARLKKSIKKEEQTKQIMIQAQLDALKNQAQPHFLFNSLNTLRDIVDQNSKEEIKEFVDNLSGIYRFILEAGNTNIISLREEIKFAKSYIHIQSERFGDNLKVNWNIDETKLNSMIIPMSLQLLIENAIKHNVVSRSKPLIIDIDTNDEYLVVQNKIQPKSTKVASTKIGLQNIEKRYSLISEKTPVIKNDGSDFIVSLPLLNTTLTK